MQLSHHQWDLNTMSVSCPLWTSLSLNLGALSSCTTRYAAALQAEHSDAVSRHIWPAYVLHGRESLRTKDVIHVGQAFPKVQRRLLQVLSVVGLLQDETDPMVSVMKVHLQTPHCVICALCLTSSSRARCSLAIKFKAVHPGHT